jgi:hypothetical protein
MIAYRKLSLSIDLLHIETSIFKEQDDDIIAVLRQYHGESQVRVSQARISFTRH